MLYDNILKTAGNTPVVRLNNIKNAGALENSEIYLKLEYFNPAGSVKDRIGVYIIEKWLNEGKINGKSVIVEPTSGNTGIGLAMACAFYGIRLILTMPESMSAERRKILAGYGAEIVLTPASEGMSGAIAEAENIKNAVPGAVIVGQFDNPLNPEAHYFSTAEEIFKDIPDLAAVVAGAGTGGTVTGIAEYIADKGLKTAVYAVEPAESAVLSGDKKGAHNIQGIGAGFIPYVMDLSLLTGIIKITTEEAVKTAKDLMKKEGIACGISSGAAAAAALKLSGKINGKILAVIPDNALRYLSTELFG